MPPNRSATRLLRVPGVNAWFGNEFNRHNTWFSQLDVFNDYIKRCNYMLPPVRAL